MAAAEHFPNSDLSKRAIKSRDRLIDDSLSFISCNSTLLVAISISAAERLN